MDYRGSSEFPLNGSTARKPSASPMLSSVGRSATKSPMRGAPRAEQIASKRVHSSRNGLGELPLHVAAAKGNRAIAALLLESGATADAQDDLGRTALYICADLGHEEMARFLIDHGADLFKYTNTGKSPLDAARKSKFPNIVRYIQEAHLHYAARKGHAETVRRLVQGKGGEDGVDINAVDSHDRTAVTIAAAAGHLDTVRTLLEMGANVTYGVPPAPLVGTEAQDAVDERIIAEIRGLLLVCQETNADAREDQGVVKTEGDHFVAKAAMNDVVAVAQMLSDGLPVDASNSDGFTALHAACKGGHVEVVRVLLDHGADTTACDALSGSLPMHYAVMGGHSRVVELLLRR